jgi:3-oxoacyl-(acyl-carrier-protein) synthase
MLSDPAANDPMAFCRSQATAGVALLTRQHNICGYATSVHTACASGGQALGTALKLIRRGAVDYALAGGFDSMISPVGISGFCLLSALSPDNEAPQSAAVRSTSRATASSWVKARASSCWRSEAARRRGARIARSSQATATRCRALPNHRFAARRRWPDPGHARRDRRRRRDARDVDYLNARSTSTPMNDRSESAATHAVFGEHVGALSVSSTKSTMGHLIPPPAPSKSPWRASPFTTAKCRSTRISPSGIPIATFNLIVDKPRRQHVRMTLSNSFSFGGSNSCVVLRNPVEVDGVGAAGH